MRAFAREVNSVILVSANLYTRTLLNMASPGTYTVVHAVQLYNCGTVVAYGLKDEQNQYFSLKSGFP